MSDDSMDAVLHELRRFTSEREWAQFHDPKNLAMAVASEAGELLAEYRWVRNEEADQFSLDEAVRARVQAEAADVGIALLLFFDRIGVDPLTAIREKIERNRANYPIELSRGHAERPLRDGGQPTS